MQSNIIFHIANTADVEHARNSGVYRCESLSNEGFIHCCEHSQLPGVVSRYYDGIDDLWLLMIDAEQLESALIRENTMGNAELFPHVYGPIAMQAVTEVLEFGLDSVERRALIG
ncbi:MAG: DUF952 domain-containing protein [Granulosicoccus sp.]